MIHEIAEGHIEHQGIKQITNSIATNKSTVKSQYHMNNKRKQYSKVISHFNTLYTLVEIFYNLIHIHAFMRVFAQ